eukprot:CAMPEP_0206298260 /NCGR_PEP_ID=MMETSP0106_2-20121207/6598_1 /ASSEMBLY_ACC=CAM_ASM_000206 /TAXON_ID=81532 /ORGANISM="Acanthoeca-like sp., Strain 10tr" /LENGTH=333 /DNA_ID=CAMNT_0053728955 /DNA_START=44 /DNA_END=1045 /DNA_ORIENTATION=+
MKVAQLEIDPRHAAALAKAGLTRCADLLVLSTPELARRAALSDAAARAAKVAAAEAEFGGTAVTALMLLEDPAHRTARLTSGCLVLDKVLRGGLLTRGLTEVVGESASAKTQFCLQLALTVQLPPSAGGLGGGAVFICTEDAFPNKRMAQLAETCGGRWPALAASAVGDRVYVEHCGTVAGLLSLLAHKVPVMVKHGVRLVVVDSIAALFRGEYGRDDSIARADDLFKISRALKALSDQWHTAIVCVNQVSDLVGDGAPRLVIPALGLAWSDMVNTRLFLQKGSGAEPRTLAVVLAPHLPPTRVAFRVDASGVHGIPTNDTRVEPAEAAAAAQ